MKLRALCACAILAGCGTQGGKKDPAPEPEKKADLTCSASILGEGSPDRETKLVLSVYEDKAVFTASYQVNGKLVSETAMESGLNSDCVVLDADAYVAMYHKADKSAHAYSLATKEHVHLDCEVK